jgi:hypothetical protein
MSANQQFTSISMGSSSSAVFRSSVNQTFSSIIAGAGTGVNTLGASGTVLTRLTASSTTNQYASLTRSILVFDTSALSTNDIVTNASIVIAATTGSTGLGDNTVQVVSASPANPASIVAADYSNIGSTSFGSVSTLAISTSAVSLVLNASGIAALNLGGTSSLGLKLGWDQAASFTGTWSSGANSSYSLTVTSTTVKLNLWYFDYTAGSGYSTGLSSTTGMSTLQFS